MLILSMFAWTSSSLRFGAPGSMPILNQNTLGDLFDYLEQDRVNLWMDVQEVSIVKLFIFEAAQFFLKGNI